MTKKRLPAVDVLRGIGIFCMVAGHVYFGMLFDKYIHAFHMPMFFIISGYFYKQRESSLSDVVSSLGSKVKSLLIPYAFFALLAVLIWIIFLRPDLQALKAGLLSVLWINTLDFPVSGALWFLTVLFLVYLLAGFMDLFKSLIIKLILLIAFMTIGSLWTRIFDFRLPFGLDVAFVGVGLFAFGYIVRNYFPKLLKLPIYISIPAFVFVSALCIVNGYVNMRLASYAIIPLFWFNACAMTILLWNICTSICDKFVKIKAVGLVCRELEFVGQNSIVYLCLNQIVIMALVKIVKTFLPAYYTVSAVMLMANLIIFFIAMLALHFLVFLFEGRRGVLIGKSDGNKGGV